MYFVADKGKTCELLMRVQLGAKRIITVCFCDNLAAVCCLHRAEEVIVGGRPDYKTGLFLVSKFAGLVPSTLNRVGDPLFSTAFVSQILQTV